MLFTIEGGVPAIALQGVYAKRFFRELNPSHVPPHSLLYMRLVRLLQLSFRREYLRLIDDNIIWLGANFASTNSDFYKNPKRKESYGCAVATMASHRYDFKEGRKLFVSKQSLNEGARTFLACPSGILDQLETVNSFRKFDGLHTGKGIGQWLADEHESCGLLPQYVGYHCTDGAANAVASANEYQLLTEMNTDSPFNHQKCLAHQANRSAKYASGTGEYVENSNPQLFEVLRKTHRLVARVHKSSACITVMREIQTDAKRLVVTLPSPSVPTRWDSCNREVASVNRVMGDFNKGLVKLIEGNDKRKLVVGDGSLLPASDFTFSLNDKLILRQFECASEPCVKLSKFYQLNGATSHEVIFVTAAYISMMRDTWFAMYEDISHSDIPDLKNRKKTVYVLASNYYSLEDETGRNEQPMDPCIEKFRKLYADDMEERCGFTEGPGLDVAKLPVDTAIALLLNPVYGGFLRIVDAGLMTKEQYDHAEQDLIGRMQLMRERESGGHVESMMSSGGSEAEDDLDDPVVRSLSSERERAKDEFRIYCNLVKQKRNAPKSYVGGALQLGSIKMGKVLVRGDDIKASHPFITCNLADFIDDNGHFDLVSFLQLERECFPTLYKLSVCLSSIRTNEVGCERFFSMAGYVSCPRRTRLKVGNYECLATLKSNIQRVFIDERWVVDQYIMMEQKKCWKDIDTAHDMTVLNLERELLAESLAVDESTLPTISDCDPIVEEPPVEPVIVDVDAE